MQQEIDIFNLAFVRMATGYVKRVAERTLKEEPEARGAAQQFRLELADEVSMANLLAVTVGKLWDKMAQEPPREPIQEQQKDGPKPVKLGPGVYLRMENAYVSAPDGKLDGWPVNVWGRLKNLCEFCKEMSTRGGIWAERAWGIDAVALEFAIAQIEGAQTAQEAAQDAPEAAADETTAQAEQEAPSAGTMVFLAAEMMAGTDATEAAAGKDTAQGVEADMPDKPQEEN